MRAFQQTCSLLCVFGEGSAEARLVLKKGTWKTNAVAQVVFLELGHSPAPNCAVYVAQAKREALGAGELGIVDRTLAKHN